VCTRAVDRAAELGFTRRDMTRYGVIARIPPVDK
jgi:hypothetical protein